MEMKTNPVLSFIIPVYNSEATLRECVDSILNQEEKNIEIILVDDGSEEKCKNLCDIIAMENQNIVYTIHKKNGGSLSARIEGAKKAKGNYIVYVDSDDILLQSSINSILKDICFKEAELYIYDYIMDNIGGTDKKIIKIMNFKNKTYFKDKEKKKVSIAFMQGKMNTVCATVIKKELLKRCLLEQYREKIKHGEDRLQKMFLLINAKSILYVPYAFYYYRWFSGTQGEEVRIGDFNSLIFKNFCLTWQPERANYIKLGFSSEEKYFYDEKKLSRICSLFENSYINKKIKWYDLKKLVNILSQNDLFKELCEEKVIKNTRIHIKIISKLILKKEYVLLKIYWQVCHIIRKIIHSK